MALDQEQFERLEAYLDGELGSVARAEVDAQLNANPQLRKLMNELAKSRDLVRGLPRAKAPADLLESFQSQLERAELFGDAGAQESDVVARISRAPQYMAIAAVVLLALGVAGIIYKVMLPHRQPAAVAISNNPPSMEAAPSEELRKSRAAPATEPFALQMDTSTPLTSREVAASVAPRVPEAAMPAKTETDRNLVTEKDVNELKKQMASASQPAFDATNGGPIVMVVRSQSPRIADEQVRRYLGANGISYVEDQAAPGGLANRDQVTFLNNAAVAERSVGGGRAKLQEQALNVTSAASQAVTQQSQQPAINLQELSNTIGAASQNSAPAAIFAQQQNSFANSNIGFGAAQIGNTYRARLTQHQLQDLNNKLQTRGDQWTEFRNAPFGSENGFEFLHQTRALATSQLASLVPATQPTTAPTTHFTALPLAVAVTQPSATTKPAATTSPAEPSREVVIVVNNEPIELPATVPTQAATAPTTAP